MTFAPTEPGAHPAANCPAFDCQHQTDWTAGDSPRGALRSRSEMRSSARQSRGIVNMYDRFDSFTHSEFRQMFCQIGWHVDLLHRLPHRSAALSGMRQALLRQNRKPARAKKCVSPQARLDSLWSPRPDAHLYPGPPPAPGTPAANRDLCDSKSGSPKSPQSQTIPKRVARFAVLSAVLGGLRKWIRREMARWPKSRFS